MSEHIETVETLADSSLKVTGMDNKFNSAGDAICRLCGHAARDLAAHLDADHKMTVAEYQERFPGFPVTGLDAGDAGRLLYKEREKKMFSVHATFGFYWDSKSKKDKQVQGYATPGPLTPPIDPDYVFDPEATSVLLLGSHLKNKVLMYGPTGSGKTTLVEQICARLNFNFVRINFDGYISRSDLVGQYVVKGRTMEFSYGILPRGMILPGTIILLDEWDSIGEEVSFVLQRVLETKSQLLLMEKGEELVSLHPENMIIATANTSGMGDDSGLYSQGTRIQNYSQINRFAMTIILDYLSAKQEKKILTNRFSDLESWEAEALVQVVNSVRDAYMKGKDVSAPLSTRDLINWAEKFTIWGDPVRAAKFCFINRAPLEERGVLEGLVQRAFE